MKRTVCFALSLTLSLAIVSVASATPMVITGITTSTGNLDGNLLSVTTAGGTSSVTAFASAADANVFNVVALDGSLEPNPANRGAAVSDQRADTGALSNEPLTYNLTPTNPADSLFFIFNSGGGTGFQAPLTVTAVDGGGMAIGNLVAINSNTGTVGQTDANPGTDDLILAGDAFATYTAARPNGEGTLNGRLLAGATVDLADFGVSDLSTIAGFVFDGENAAFSNVNSLDINAVGLVGETPVVPEPTSLALFAFAAIASAVRGRR